MLCCTRSRFAYPHTAWPPSKASRPSKLCRGEALSLHCTVVSIPAHVGTCERDSNCEWIRPAQPGDHWACLVTDTQPSSFGRWLWRLGCAVGPAVLMASCIVLQNAQCSAMHQLAQCTLRQRDGGLEPHHMTSHGATRRTETGSFFSINLHFAGVTFTHLRQLRFNWRTKGVQRRPFLRPFADPC